jgi:hypothetical protein
MSQETVSVPNFRSLRDLNELFYCCWKQSGKKFIDPSLVDGYSLQRIATAEGPYVTTGGISQADGLDLIAKIQAGATVVAQLSTEMSITTT